MVERRAYPRIPARYKVHYKRAGTLSGIAHKAVTENVSRTGLKIKINDPLKKGDTLELNIYKENDNRPINAVGKVMWETSSLSNNCEKVAGIFFTRIGWTESEKLTYTQS